MVLHVRWTTECRSVCLLLYAVFRDFAVVGRSCALVSCVSIEVFTRVLRVGKV